MSKFKKKEKKMKLISLEKEKLYIEKLIKDTILNKDILKEQTLSDFQFEDYYKQPSKIQFLEFMVFKNISRVENFYLFSNKDYKGLGLIQFEDFTYEIIDAGLELTGLEYLRSFNKKVEQNMVYDPFQSFFYTEKEYSCFDEFFIHFVFMNSFKKHWNITAFEKLRESVNILLSFDNDKPSLIDNLDSIDWLEVIYPVLRRAIHYKRENKVRKENALAELLFTNYLKMNLSKHYSLKKGDLRYILEYMNELY
jgi:hypothetical protein